MLSLDRITTRAAEYRGPALVGMSENIHKCDWQGLFARADIARLPG